MQHLLAFFSYALILFQFFFAPSARAVIYDRQGRALAPEKLTSSDVDWRLLFHEKDAAYNGVGVFQYQGYQSCSGFLLATGGQGQAPAYAITAGHCYNWPKPYPKTKNDTFPPFFVDVPATSLFFVPGYFVDDQKSAFRIPVKRWSFAMTSPLDLAIVELGITYEALLKQGFRVYSVSTEPFNAIGEPARVVGAPQSNSLPGGPLFLPKNKRFLRASDCTSSARYYASFNAAFILSDQLIHSCSIAHGSSGGPLFSVADGRVLGIVTTSENSRSLYSKNTAETLAPLPGCFTKQGLFDLDLPSCKLEQPCIGTKEQSDACVLKQCEEKGISNACLRLVRRKVTQNWREHPEQEENSEYGPEILRLIDFACGLGDGLSCSALGSRYRMGKEVEKSVARSRFYSENACLYGVKEGCRDMSVFHEKENNPEAQVSDMLYFREYGCHLGDPRSCAWMGDAYYFGEENFPAQFIKSIPYYERACDLNWGSACAMLGDIHESGKAPKSSTAQARKFFQKACKLGHKEAC